ncbi:SdiA-regulated domain-containing protein [Psychroserpens mesophilus]|uniref:SdiA-regulated domain-containing protein n=1 Tax=Psychroserpens mesophilus TaxID=325473 RepID=UPI003D660552
MKAYIKPIFIGLFLMSCSTGKLDALADITSSLKETSALEKTKDSNILWVIQDAGNNNHLYGLDIEGHIIKDITVNNAENRDWEDLTSDSEGNIYIGDFGNNNEKRKDFTIYQVPNAENVTDSVEATAIHFTLPDDMDSADFESFFLHQGFFYIFSKDKKTCKLIKVPHIKGKHEARFISEIQLKGKHNKVTSADISEDGSIVVLLNHDKLWKLTNFSNDDFFSGTIEALEFEHDSQKEGINLVNDHQVLITDERNKYDGGNIYLFDF